MTSLLRILTFDVMVYKQNKHPFIVRNFRIPLLMDPKHTRDYRERFFIEQNRTKRAHFRGSPLFQATYDIKTKQKQTNKQTRQDKEQQQLIHLACVS